jgi:glutamyl-tRNA synthetase
MAVVTRFAPSPTGFLHIGGARTALFNWLFSRHGGGKFLLRIEDTDKARSTPEAIASILEGLSWLGIEGEGDTVFQSQNIQRHQEVAQDLLKRGHAYVCYTTPEELEHMRAEAKAQGRPPLYNGLWRDRDPTQGPPGMPGAVRLKVPKEGETVLWDQVQGVVRVRNDQLDDMVLLRADGTPTYMLSVVVDDHDMGITHVIRGDDHLTNTFRQAQIYQAMGWSLPTFAHIPLIHGPDGNKLSKRHGALSVQEYAKMGFLPEALCNYLLRLGWGHGDTEIISKENAAALFSLENVGKSPSRFDLAKLTALNAHYLRHRSDADLVHLIDTAWQKPSVHAQARLLKGMSGLKTRAKTLLELEELAEIYLTDGLSSFTKDAHQLLQASSVHTFLSQYCQAIGSLDVWSAPQLEEATRQFVGEAGIKLGALAQPLRAALTGRLLSPPVFEVMEVLGPQLTQQRIQEVLNHPGKTGD